MKSFVLILAAIAFVNAIIPVYPKNEILFKYKADFRTGVIDSDILGTQFVLEADLSAQYYANSRLGVLYFSNAKISINSGKIPLEGDVEQENLLPIISSASDFENPFLVGGPDDENIILTNQNEPAWIVNVKKSVASLFTFDWDTFETNERKNTFHSFETEEDSLYGKCVISYTMIPEKDKWVITKKQDPLQCSDFTQSVRGTEENSCDNGWTPDDDYVVENIRIYEIAESNRNDYFTRYFKRIDADGNVLIFPFGETGNLKYTNVKQTIEFVKNTPVKKLRFGNMVKHSMQLSFDDYDESEFLAATYAEPNVEIPSTTNAKHCAISIETLSTNIPEADLYNIIIKIFRYYKIEDFENCLKEFESETYALYLGLYLKIIPMIGTTASVNFIKNVIMTRELSPIMGRPMIQFLPSHVLVPTEEMLVNLKELLDSDFKFNPYAKTDMILAYGTLIYKTFKKNPESSVLEEYINTFYNNLKTAETFSEQLIWIQGLSNIQLGSVWKLVISLIKGDQILNKEYDYHLGIHAISAASNFISEHKTEYLNALWAIIINITMEKELREIAIQVYIDGCETREDISQIFWYMQTESDQQIYNTFTEAINTIAKSSNHCKSPVYNYVKQMKEHMKSSDGTKYVVFADYFNEKTGFGGEIYNEVRNYNKHHYSSVNVYAMRKSFHLFSSYREWRPFNVTYSDRVERVKINDIVVFNDKVIYTDISTHPGIFRPSFIDKILFQSEGQHFHYLLDLININKMIPSDIGLPITFNTRMPLLTGFASKFTVESDNIYSSAFNLRQDLFGSHSVVVYNPFINVYHGIMDEVQYKINLAINTTNSRRSFKIRLDQFTDDDIIKFENRINSYVFLSHLSDFELLADMCNNCSSHLPITINDNKFEEIDITKTLSEVGLDYKEQISQCSEDSDPLKSLTFVKDIFQLLEAVVDVQYWALLRYLTYVFPSVFDIFSCNRNIEITSNDINPFEELSLFTSDNNLTILINALDTSQNIRWEGRFDKEDQFRKSVHFSRSVERHPILNICLFFIEKKDPNSFIGEILWYQGYSFNTECVKDDTFIRMSFNDQKSEEQENALEKGYTYKNCESNSKYLSIALPITLNCINDHTSLRHYLVNIEYQKLPNYFNTMFKYISQWFKENSVSAIKYDYSTSQEFNKFALEFINPMQSGNSFRKVIVRSPEETYEAKILIEMFDLRIFNKNWKYYSQLHGSCIVYLNDFNEDYARRYAIIEETNEWITLADFGEDRLKMDGRKISDEYMEIRITIYNDTFIVRPDETEEYKFSFSMDDKFMEYIRGADDELNIKLFKINDSIVFHMNNDDDFMFIFNGKYVKTSYCAHCGINGICQGSH